jgi:hypothetical protein
MQTKPNMGFAAFLLTWSDAAKEAKIKYKSRLMHYKKLFSFQSLFKEERIT